MVQVGSKIFYVLVFGNAIDKLYSMYYGHSFELTNELYLLMKVGLLCEANGANI